MQSVNVLAKPDISGIMGAQQLRMPTQTNTIAKTTKPLGSATSLAPFAVIKTGGKQYRVSIGSAIKIEKLSGASGEVLKKGDTVNFTEVLLTDDGVSTIVGAPFIEGKTVTGTIDVVGRAPKVLVIKYKQKSRYMKKNGHRQPYMKVIINTI